jgi:hypothetical protein
MDENWKWSVGACTRRGEGKMKERLTPNLDMDIFNTKITESVDRKEKPCMKPSE